MKLPRLLVTSVAAALLLAGCSRSSDNSGAGGSSGNSGSASSAGGSSADAANSSESNASPGSAQPDNTGQNVRDRSDTALTPGDQGGSDSDREITRRIRRAINANDQLSTEAKNIKIITTNGKVTLRGPVQNEQEQKAIQAIAQQAGVATVDNQLQVKTTSQ